MKTPEDVKKALACCENADCKACPYDSVGVSIVDCLEALVGDATAYINQLEARVPKWISVEDRLPEDDVNVIVYAVSNNGGYTIVVTFHTHTLYGLNIEGWASPWQYFTSHYTITHWMPLPEPPKEE